MRPFILFCIVGGLIAPQVRGADDTRIAALVERLQNGSDAAASREAFMELRGLLRDSAPEVIAAAQNSLCQALRISNDAWAVRRIALVLAAAPCEQAVVVMAERLGSHPPAAMSMALCDGIHAVAGERPALSPGTIARALGNLEAIARNGRLPGPVVESAVMATAAFGSPGFNQLIKLKQDRTVSGKALAVMYSAISETDDPRAPMVLRQAITDPSICESRRAQAMHGLGQFFSRAASAGQSIDPVERERCVGLLERHLANAPDRVFVAALRAMARMVNVKQSIALERATLGALESASEIRREAALDVLHRQEHRLGLEISAVVERLEKSDRGPNVRSAAAAVLEKQRMLQGGAEAAE